MKNIIYDGINVVFNLQGSGKTYITTHKAVHELINPKSNRKVVSNYPITFTIYPTKIQKLLNLFKTKIKITHSKSCYVKKIGYKINIIKPEPLKEKHYSSYQLEKEHIGSSLRDALLIVDESNEWYTGAYAWEMTKEERKYFGRLRHNNVAIYFITIHYSDLPPFILKRVAYLHEVKKTKYPWSKVPSSFSIDTYTSIKNYMKRDDHKIHKKAKRTLFNHESISFNLLVGNAYKTHAFRDKRPEPKLRLWSDVLEEEMKELSTQQPYIEIIPKPTSKASSTNIKDAVSALRNLYKWTKKDSLIEVNKVIIENPEIDSTEGLIRKALERRADTITKRINLEDEEIDDET